jgi:hypothetical protein
MREVNYAPRKGGFCGPTVVAAITGRPYAEVTRIIRHQTGRRAIMGTSIGELASCLAHLGYEVGRGERQDDRPTLARWARRRTGEQRARMCIVEVTGHWVLVHSRWFLDTKTKGKPVLLKDAPGRRKRVKNVYPVRGK